MPKTVLVAVDLDHAEMHRRVLREGARLAGFYEAKLCVITVLPPLDGNVSTYFRDDAADRMIHDTQVALHRFTRETLGSDKHVQHIICHGSTYEQILAMAEEISADLVVMGAHKPKLQDFIMGPNAARVSRHCRCSVYIVRETDDED
ncbi:universal stress protein [Roseospira navarrensis]|uniref:Universal stress protein n=1 Tax=Roseospira navarrensis TaxID=140058 RepID=A0A7X1ZEJ2_9PROT|nr:universal stress protein [Roseospira navarrensis]MQX37109.1 universal stress protein [Roseospira navarrensis]